MTDLICNNGTCTSRATRQEYASTSEEEFARNPWASDNYVALCADHASPDSWPLVDDDDVEDRIEQFAEAARREPDFGVFRGR